MIEIHKSHDNQLFVRYKGNNGEILASSETVKSKASAKKNILAMAGLFRVDSKEPIKVIDYSVCTPKEIVL
jgi:uncharacterized protein YegP (UPF0339 family)